MTGASSIVLLWGALVGVVTQLFINMEVEQYTLATGETVLTGCNRFWRHWGTAVRGDGLLQRYSPASTFW